MYNDISVLRDALKLLPAVKSYYSSPNSKTASIFTDAKEEFDYEEFLTALKTNYRAFYNYYIHEEHLFKIEISEDHREKISKAVSSNTSWIETIQAKVLSEYDINEKGELIHIQNMLLLSLMQYDAGEPIETLDSIGCPNLIEGDVKKYYRGLSDFDYGVLPTMLRNLSYKKDCIFNYASIETSYRNSNLANRYADRIGTINETYKFCAFMQHAREYSTLLDFTDEKNIAISFACSNVSDYNSYSSKDAAILEINVPNDLVVTDETVCNDLIRNTDIYVCASQKMSSNSTVRGKRIYYCTKDDFEVKAHLIDLKTNDRMRYQKGCFLLFSKAVMTKKDILIPLGLPTCIKKHRIICKNKKKLYEQIEKTQHWLDVDHLMDPYKYFSEAPIEW